MAELERCPSCGAGVPAGAAWCSLCFADLRPPPEEPPVPLVEPAAAPPVEPLAPPPVAGTAASETSVSQPAPGALPDPSLPGVDAMLAELAAQESARTPAVVGRFGSRGTRVAVMIGGTVALSLLLVAVIWVLGVVL